MADLKVVTNHSNENYNDDASDSESELPWKKRFKMAPTPRRKLLVLCLGGLLVNRVYIRHRRSAPAPPLNPDVYTGSFAVFKRPFCTDFIKFCFERFELGIWSATVECNTEAVLKCIGGSEMKTKLAFVWGREECIDSGIACQRNSQKPLFLKDLRRVWEKKYLDLPWRRGQYSQSNTLLICVDPPTSLLNPPNTAIFPQPYKSHDMEDTFLGPDGELRGYLERIADVDNVPSYIKEHPFGQPAITPSHPDWNYYAKIVHEFQKEDDEKYQQMKSIDLV
ncbi:Hypothetical predicted protein [Olea europaea subsp. europaea]|uniref:Mitochondrial import inner membrane translocase subunit TIM50 n=1 Tax=Olea europaea subsp. europaea TaxID=158383 RepID=A0A8S0SNY3_OLEEU|nr:Hypothetical predicted protein [Olea europaea subsp. europaea]